MPIYEYRCRSCDHELEALQKLSEPPLVECPECQQQSLYKKVSAAGFRLKGGGWYETDFKSDGKRNLAGDGDAKAKSADGGGADSKDGGGKSDAAAGAAASAKSDGASKKADSGKSSSKTSDAA